MRPVFDLLASQEYLQLVHRDVGTTAELQYYAAKMVHGRYKRFTIVHLAFHGNPGKLWVGDDHVDLEGLANLLGEACRDRVVHFGSCSTMRVSAARLAAFKERTGAVAVSATSRTSAGSSPAPSRCSCSARSRTTSPEQPRSSTWTERSRSW